MNIVARKSTQRAEYVVYEIPPANREPWQVANEVPENRRRSVFRLTLRRRYGDARAAGQSRYPSAAEAMKVGEAFIAREETKRALERAEMRVFIRPRRRKRK